MKNYFLLLVFSVLYAFQGCAQIIDDFSDGSLGGAVLWHGDTADFKINSNRLLQLNATQAGTSAISVVLDTMEVWQQAMEWNFRIKLAFAPSNNNYARIYVLADNVDLKSESLHAYYLQFGENLAQDAIELFYTDGTQHISVLRGTDAMIASSFDLRVKLLRSATGEWSLYVDNTDFDVYQLQASATFTPQFSAKAAGIYCKYTSGNISKFYFDDFYIGSQRIDNERPKVTACYAYDDLRTVVLAFSKYIDESALEPQHYQVMETAAVPVACEYLFPDYRQVALTFPADFEEDRPYQLRVSGIRDMVGNELVDTVVTFTCHRVKRNDVLIHEIMADPTPVVGLPSTEYIELYNRTGVDLQLSNWKIQLGKNLRTLPDMMLAAHSYAVLAAGEGVEQLRAFCDQVVALSSMSITDGGQELVLYSNYDEVVHTVKFKDSWHRNKVKRDGGWSLEMIDTGNPCTGEENWDSSIDASGGTPGRRNSIAAENADYTAPEMVSATLVDSTRLRVFFSETVLLSPQGPSVFTVDHELGIADIKLVPPTNRAVDIYFDRALRPAVVYQLTLNAGVCDCVGLPAQEGQTLQFGVDAYPNKKDVIINELLSDPPGSDDADYVEIYNRSEKIIDLKNVKIGSSGDALPDKSVVAVGEGYQLFPQQMVALCKSRKLTQAHYHPLYPQRLLQCDSLPAFANAEGVVHLTDIGLQPIDRLQYNEEMHYSMLTSTDGVALERVHYEGETQDADNWKSAAASVGFGTPGYQNSQSAELLSSEDELRLEPDIFSPDNDGFDDYVEVYCQFQDAENRVTLVVYAQNGQLVKKLANNELCGGEVRYLWDGTDEDGHLASPGLYVVRLQYWNLSGKKRNRSRVVGLR
jgi:hypothetical protein